ncbi:mRNA capping enzyme [Fadolivirus algeromassiliense]|jgi:SAM-dependent methyltransferase|uniref:mRNA capping enzyme n=1 Tax=Fadolivirus FV1/VV64 TaxID=3070911 RepID=A0A7D3QVT9_9VIRU|nr:mRNA capping enzyme [Fadolivirus algeromassiliense]QKF93919.1 mRNA capping enzyme [Fadolivirus FV1/VV64]
MYKADILDSLNKYYKDNPKLVFYKDCIDKINNYKFNDNQLLFKLKPDNYLLESVRINLCYNQDKYHVYLYNKKKKNCTNYLIKVDDIIKDKLLNQLVCITEYNDILSLSKKIKIPPIKFNKKDNNNHIYIIISNKPKKFNNTYYEFKNLYEISGYVFGVDIKNLLKYQRLDRIIEFINKGGESLKLYELLNNYYKILKSYSWQERERIIVHSGVIWQALGLTYTRDIDILVLAENEGVDNARKLNKKFNDYNIEIESTVLANDGNWYTIDQKIYKYKANWFTHILPSLSGADDIFEVISNPVYNFSFMGIKFLSIDMNIKRFLSRSNPNSLTDLIMFEKLNGFKLGENLCIPNMTIRQGKLVVFDEKAINDIHFMVKRKVKEFYNYDITLDEVKNILKKCNLQAYNIYKGKNVYDPDTYLIKRFHLDVKQQIFYKYCKGIEYLLDVGSGQLTDAQYWNRVGVKNVIGIEPSVDSIKKGLERLEKFGTKTNIKLINGVGDVDWKSDKKYSSIFNHKYDVITFQYTLHYMIYNIDTLINNILQVTKKGTKIIVNCMDGRLIHSELNKHGRIEVRNEQEPIFAIVPMYDYKQSTIPPKSDVLVYFKGAYGVASGSVEPLIDITSLIRKFGENNYKLLEIKKFLDYNSQNKNKMSNTQKKVSYYYTSLIFEYYKQ